MDTLELGCCRYGSKVRSPTNSIFNHRFTHETAVATTLYLSRSFREEDEALCERLIEIVNGLLEDQEYDAELVDSEYEDAEQLAEHIENDIDRADVVLLLFSRRYETDEGHYVPPSYVVSEAGYARARDKRLVAFLEEDVPSEEMGLIDAFNPNYVQFNRDELNDVGFRARVRDAISTQLREHEVALNPPHEFLRYKLHHTVYPNGYILSHYKVRVKAIRDEDISHHFQLLGDADVEELPPADELQGRFGDEPCPYPRIPFVAFRTPERDLTFEPVESEPERRRGYCVRVPQAGRTYEYQWMYGTPGGFDNERRLEWNRLKVSDRPVRRVDYLLRRHRDLTNRVDPRVVEIGGGTRFEDLNEETFRPYYDRGNSAPEEVQELTPVYDCFNFTVSPIPRAVDLLFFF